MTSGLGPCLRSQRIRDSEGEGTGETLSASRIFKSAGGFLSKLKRDEKDVYALHGS